MIQIPLRQWDICSIHSPQPLLLAVSNRNVLQLPSISGEHLHQQSEEHTVEARDPFIKSVNNLHNHNGWTKVLHCTTK
jgi:hypothetical protein